jgi:23S rRNA (cytosine1962-C5)-methyltransferase
VTQREPTSDPVELLDAGAGRRLERLGERIVDRPHPGAMLSPEAPARWREADLRFERDAGWRGRADPLVPWTVAVAGLTLELRATDSGGVGLFPEQLWNVPWVEAEVRARSREGQGSGPAGAGVTGAGAAAADRPAVLNLFAHTGLLTLAAAKAGAAVTHVDASRSAVAWARRNAELSGLAEAPIRWIVDDALGFCRREARRERRYEGILLDPPTYGHGGKRPWRIEADLPEFLAACASIAADDAFVLLSAHSTGLDNSELVAELRHAWRHDRSGSAGGGPSVDMVPLELHATSGARLPLGVAIRMTS